MAGKKRLWKLFLFILSCIETLRMKAHLNVFCIEAVVLDGAASGCIFSVFFFFGGVQKGLREYAEKRKSAFYKYSSLNATGAHAKPTQYEKSSNQTTIENG